MADAPSDPARTAPARASADFAAVARAVTSSDAPLSASELLPIVYAEMRRLAAARLRGDRGAASLSPTGLVHEAYLKLVGAAGGTEPSWSGRGHFFAAAATAMRRILVDRARRRRRRASAEGAAATCEDAVDSGEAFGERALDLVALDDALTALAAVDPRRHDVVMARYFGGLGVEETAEILGVGSATVKRDWAYARAWLIERMGGA
jgi:RNA polymerase sigma factor (TIGR02999 family)